MKELRMSFHKRNGLFSRGKCEKCENAGKRKRHTIELMVEFESKYMSDVKT